MTILDVRGTHGSGKSWVAHQLINQYGATEIVENGVVTGLYCASLELAIVGKYGRVCGGCDGINFPDEVCRRVREFSSTYRHTMLEGILVAHTHKRYSALATELADRDYWFVFLNTPLRNCIARVRARRVIAGKPPAFNTANLERDHKCIWERMPKKMAADGHKTVVADYRDPLPTILKLLER